MFDKVKAIFEEQLGVSQDEMKLDTNFKDDLGVDSLDLYEIVMKLEDEFDVEIPAEELDDVATFEDVLNYLKSKGVDVSEHPIQKEMVVKRISTVTCRSVWKSTKRSLMK